ncbi:helix-turn-helix transcriptional regulator [Phormidium sp. FACHB-592]|uniref:helix-turn-helix domain-containing protein n=1 Tax=Stenomitos frigidus TaxID=1886765 RepID=UPI0016888CB9|nr:helix-turn-helix transcriptional regulator [Phormidium sp. FACHB-592]
MVQRRLSPRELRDRVNKTQFEIAVEIGKQPSTLSDWETGRRSPSLKLHEVKKMMRAYEATLEELIWAFDRIDPDEL